MKPESFEEVLKAHLAREDLVICRSVDAPKHLDGIHEAMAVRGIAVLAADSFSVDNNWDDDITAVRAVDARLLNQCRFAS